MRHVCTRTVNASGKEESATISPKFVPGSHIFTILQSQTLGKRCENAYYRLSDFFPVSYKLSLVNSHATFVLV